MSTLVDRWVMTKDHSVDELRDLVEAERARLEKIVIDMGEENKRLHLKLERLQEDYAERGKVNARLNKELQRRHDGTK